MAGIRLEFAQFGDFDSFDIIRSDSSMTGIAEIDLPNPIIAGLSTMYYVDTNVEFGETYYYKARVWHDGTSKLSSEIKVLASEYMSLIISDNPIAYYPLNELAGNFAADIMSSPANGTIYNCLLGQAVLSNALGSCYYFNGSSSRIELGSPSKFLLNQASMECWVKIIDGNYGGNTLQIGYNTGLRMQLSSTANMIFNHANKLSSSSLTNDTLYHIVFTCTQTSLSIYINGVLDTSLSGGGGWYGIGSIANSAIGYSGSFYNNEYLKGYLGHVALYDYALTAERVLAHYNAGVATA